MKKRSIVIRKPGSFDKLQLEETEILSLREDEILIECKACGVNFADCCVRMGVYSSAKKYVGWPITPGFEVAGFVLKTGSNVTDYKEGDRVIAVTRFGGYTSHLTVNNTQAFHLAESISFPEGAALSAVFLTAAYALWELAYPKPLQNVLVHSAGGGVGGALVQLCKILGCKVTGVVGSSHKTEYVQNLGADFVIDKSKEPLWKSVEKISPRGFDLVLDANGPETLRESYRHLASGGKLIVYGFHTMLSKNRGTPNWFKVLLSYLTAPRFDPMKMTGENRSVLAFNLSYLFQKIGLFREHTERLLKMLEQREIILPKITSYPLEKAALAHKDLESGNTIGKLILIP